MFREIITSTSLSTPAANDYFAERIYGESFNGDVTFLSTLRAVLDHRMPPDEHLYFRVRGYSFSGTNASTECDRALRSAIGDNLITVLNVDGDPESGLTALREWFTKTAGWKILDVVTALFRKSFDVLCAVNPATKNVIICAARLSMKRFHLLQCAILGMIPWYYDPSQGTTDDEKELFYALQQDQTSGRYMAAIDKFAAKYEFEYQRMRKLLGGFEKRIDSTRLRDTENRISCIRADIEGWNEQIGSAIKTMNELNITLLGLHAKLDATGEDSELLEYFSCNKRLVLDDVSGSRIYFSVRDYLTYFDEDAVSSNIANPRSNMYSYANSYDVSPDDAARIVRAVFIDQIVKLRFCAAYSFDLDGTVRGLSGHDFDKTFSTYMPNPHIQRYSCMGDYARVINQMLVDNNYIGAIEQCVASCKSLNWLDSAVMSEFFNQLYGSSCDNRKWFEIPDGTLLSMKEVLSWLHEQEEKETEEGTKNV